MNFLHSVLSAVKMGSVFFFYCEKRLAVSKTDPEVIGSRYKRYKMLPLLFQIILYHHILPLLILGGNSEIAL